MFLREKVAVLVAAAMMLVVVASPALADKGGVPNERGCGVGKDFSAELREDRNPQQYSPQPGASEVRDLPPSEAGCTGNDNEEE